MSTQYMNSPNYPREYPGGLECLHTITAAQGNIITLEVEDLDLEPTRDFVLIRDGGGPQDRVLAILSGKASDNPRFVVSTGNKLYVYTQTDQADSRKGYRIKYYEGESCVFSSSSLSLALLHLLILSVLPFIFPRLPPFSLIFFLSSPFVPPNTFYLSITTSVLCLLSVNTSSLVLTAVLPSSLLRTAVLP